MMQQDTIGARGRCRFRRGQLLVAPRTVLLTRAELHACATTQPLASSATHEQASDAQTRPLLHTKSCKLLLQPPPPHQRRAPTSDRSTPPVRRTLAHRPTRAALPFFVQTLHSKTQRRSRLSRWRSSLHLSARRRAVRATPAAAAADHPAGHPWPKSPSTNHPGSHPPYWQVAAIR